MTKRKYQRSLRNYLIQCNKVQNLLSLKKLLSTNKQENAYSLATRLAQEPPPKHTHVHSSLTTQQHNTPNSCKNLPTQCESNAEEHEGLLEDWWFREQEKEPDLHTWLCVETLRVCCPPNHYGPQCLPCKGGIENPCGGNGKCKVSARDGGCGVTGRS